MATLVKRNYRTFDNLFDELFSNLPATVGKELGWNNPPVNIHENNDGFHLELVAPGLKKEDFKVNVENGLLTVGYEKKSETENKTDNNDYKTHRREFTATSFKRSFRIDDVVNVEGIQAKYEDGILKLFLPKKEEVKVLPKEITIQ
ncbi:Hsp20/alpha crystallin family protein [Parafilimonas sp.]|jgi:HSP20 family protein|uniref:Hsp20/alpha crystallin family protein n=1 Tax=Parafilimonas sp. TaxID=1969739 RepID=UPI003F80C33B